MSYYFDTSSLVKIYHKEEGSQTVLDIYNSKDKIIISELARLEFLSSIHRRYRENEIDQQTLKILKDKFNDDIDNKFKILMFSSLVIEETISLIDKYLKIDFLRTLDCIQFSFYKAYCETDDIFVCSDKRLINVVKKEKYTVLMT